MKYSNSHITESQNGGNGKKPFPRRAMPPDKHGSTAREEMMCKRKLASLNKHTAHFNAICSRLIDENAAGNGLVDWFARNEGYLPENSKNAVRFLVKSYGIQIKDFASAHTLLEVRLGQINGKTIGFLAQNPLLLEEALATVKEGVRVGSICLELKNKAEEILGKAQAGVSAAN
jgi:hypothetical protein